MHSCRLLMEIPSTERHRAIHDIIAIGVLKGIGGEHQFRILRILRIISFFSRSIDSSEQANQPRKIDRFGFFDFSVRKWSFSKLNDGLICKNRTKNQNDNRPQERIEKKLRKTDCFNFDFPKENSWFRIGIPNDRRNSHITRMPKIIRKMFLARD